MDTIDQKVNNLLIHIGYHKTASTWLQNILFTSKSKVFEPLSMKSHGFSSLARHFILDDENHLLSPFNNNEIRIQEEIERIVKSKPELNSKIPVLSHERLSVSPHSSGFDAHKIAGMLKYSFPDAKILIVIREQSHSFSPTTSNTYPSGELQT